MISCLFHNHAIRRHFNDDEPLSESTKAHVDHCGRCRELLVVHSSLVKGLAATAEQIEPPPFLHARVMNQLRETPTPAPPRRDLRFQWAAAACAVALIAISIALLPPQRPAESTPSWPTLETQISFKTSLPENPLEAEIKNLREDTLNAAKGLAATFLPATEDSN
jgi:hypothetical protein